MTSLRWITGSSVALCAFASFGWCATIVVDIQGGGAFTAIQPALDVANDGDTVLVKPGEYVIELHTCLGTLLRILRI